MPWVSGPSISSTSTSLSTLPFFPHLLYKLNNTLIACPTLILGTLNINYIHTSLQSAFLAFTPTLSLIKTMVILFASLVKYFHLASGMRERERTIHVTISELISMTYYHCACYKCQQLLWFIVMLVFLSLVHSVPFWFFKFLHH